MVGAMALEGQGDRQVPGPLERLDAADDLKVIGTMLDRRGLLCAVCLYAPPVDSDGKANLAITVIEGYAVCEDCLGYVAQGQAFHSILTAARRERQALGGGPPGVTG